LAGWLRTPDGRACKAIAFPRLIGCDLAGGDWAVYEAMLTIDLIRFLPADVEVFIVDYDPSTAAAVNRDLEAASVAWRTANEPVSLMMSGSRTWNLPIEPFLEQFVRECIPGTNETSVTLVHGDAAGADSKCAAAGRGRGWVCTQYAFQGRVYGKKAGAMLNRDMIRAARPHYLLAFWHNQSDGTRDALVQIQADALAANSRLRGVFLVQHAGSTQEKSTFRTDFFPRDTFARWVIGSAPDDLQQPSSSPAATHRIMMTGWRDWTTPDVWPFFQQLLSNTPTLTDSPPHTIDLHHGAAPGADLLSAAAGAIRGWHIHRHPADWTVQGKHVLRARKR
jgi:hypothetical protein